MAGLQLEVRVPHSTELMAQPILQGIRKAEAGDAAGARSAYSAARAVPLSRPESWIALAALAIAVEDPAGATAHATRALQSRGDDADAWVNLGVAHWHAGRHREGAQAMHQAAMLAPGMEAAALDYSMMLRAVDQLPRAREVLERAGSANAGSWRLRLELASVCRLLQVHESARAHVLAALGRMLPLVETGRMAAPQASADRSTATADAMLVLAADLDTAGFDFHLIGSTLLALVRDGGLFAHEQDIDIAMPGLADPRRVRDWFDAHPDYACMPERGVAQGERAQVMGVVHRPSGIAIDILFPVLRDGMVECGMGWPDDLRFAAPLAGFGTLRWRDREWRVPEPLDAYFALAYGEDWRSQTRRIDGHDFDKRDLETPLSNAMLLEECRPRAITLALLRLAFALRGGELARVRALALQIGVHQRFGEVEALLAAILAHDGDARGLAGVGSGMR